MADEQSTSTDTADEAAVDTSVNSEDTSSESTDDGELEDIEVDTADITDEEDAEEATDEEADSESDESTEDEPSDEEAESEDEAEPELSDEQKRAQQAQEMYARRQQEKQARIDKVKADQAAYVAEASEEGDPHEIALRQLQVDAYNNKVEAVTNKLTNGYERALNDFPVLKTQDPVIQAEIDAAIDAFQAQNVSIDAYGNPTDVRGDLYAALQAKADSIEKLTGIRAKQQEQSKTKEKSKVLAKPTRAPREPKVDPDMEAFEEEANK